MRRQFETEYRATNKLPKCKSELPQFKGEVKNEECVICLRALARDFAVTPCGHGFHWNCICKEILLRSACPNDRQRVSLSQLMRNFANAAESLNSKYQHIPEGALVLSNNSEIPNSISYSEAETTRKVHRHKVLCIAAQQ